MRRYLQNLWNLPFNTLLLKIDWQNPFNPKSDFSRIHWQLLSLLIFWLGDFLFSRAAPSAPGPWKLLIALRRWILDIFGNWMKFILSCHWASLGLHLDVLGHPGTIPGHLGAQERTLWEPFIDFYNFWTIWAPYLESVSGTLDQKKAFFMSGFLGMNLAVRDSRHKYLVREVLQKQTYHRIWDSGDSLEHFRFCWSASRWFSWFLMSWSFESDDLSWLEAPPDPAPRLVEGRLIHPGPILNNPSNLKPIRESWDRTWRSWDWAEST